MMLERIEWLDHCEPNNAGNVWWTPDDIDAVSGPAVVESVGWVMREEADWLLMVAQRTDDGCVSQPLVILKSCIRSRTVIY